MEELILGSDDVANVGVDHLRGLRHLKRLSLRSWQLTAGCYECLADSTSLQELTLDGGKYNDTTQTLDVVPLSDEAMRRVCELTSVEVLTLKNCGIKGAVLRHLPGLPRLRKLRLQYSDVTDEGLAHLSGLPLRELALTGNDVSDEGLAHLSGMRSLRSLSLHERAIHGPGLRHVAHLPLEKLALGKASIDDDSIEYVLQCESVKSLSFIYSRVTEAGFLRLRELPRLELLSSPFSGVGPEFKAQFWEQRPGCEIYIRTFRDRPE